MCFYGFQCHRVQSYSRDKTDWIVQSPKLSYSRENSTDIGLKSPLYIDIRRSIQILRLMVKFEKRFGKQLRIHCAFGVFMLSRKNRYSPTRREKCHFPCSLDQITLFPSKFTFFMNSMNQYTHSVNRVCTLMACIFYKLSKSKPEPVRVQWSYCWRGVRVIETPLYEYWPDMRLKNLIVMPLLPSTLAEFPFLFAD